MDLKSKTAYPRLSLPTVPDYIQCLIKVFNLLKLEFQVLSSVVWEFVPVLCRHRQSELRFFSRMTHVVRELSQKPVLDGIFRWMNCSPVVWSGWTCLMWPKFSRLHAWTKEGREEENIFGFCTNCHCSISGLICICPRQLLLLMLTSPQL